MGLRREKAPHGAGRKSAAEQRRIKRRSGGDTESAIRYANNTPRGADEKIPYDGAKSAACGEEVKM